MSMYNCVLGSPISNIIVEKIGENNKDVVLLDSSTNEYKIYAVPAKFNKYYSIYIDSLSGIDVVAGFYNKGYQTRNILNEQQQEPVKYLAGATYTKYAGCKFNTATIFDKLFTKNLDNQQLSLMNAVEDDLCLFIKVPFSSNSSIVVLENCVVDNNKYNEVVNGINYRHYPKVVSNCDYSNDLEDFNHYQSSSQLIYINDDIIYPFADRLVEYLTGNAITSIDNIDLNIKRVETNLIKDKIIDHYTSGLFWNNDLRARLYLKASENNLLDTKNDILGYVDKDIEYKIVGEYDSSNEVEVS